uniref:Uncharacterized protein n=1 Tax=Meloidogyne incognita TaxID=6306 RepID=A0A914LHP1_MELIC
MRPYPEILEEYFPSDSQHLLAFATHQADHDLQKRGNIFNSKIIFLTGFPFEEKRNAHHQFPSGRIYFVASDFQAALQNCQDSSRTRRVVLAAFTSLLTIFQCSISAIAEVFIQFLLRCWRLSIVYDEFFASQTVRF